MSEKEWPLWEVFIRSKQGLNHKHVGSLRAPDAQLAVDNARDVYTYWDMKTRARDRNVGWRIDYFFANQSFSNW